MKPINPWGVAITALILVGGAVIWAWMLRALLEFFL